MLLAMLQLSRQQLLFEAQVSGQLEDHDRRLETIEAHLGDPGRAVTEASTA